MLKYKQKIVRFGIYFMFTSILISPGILWSQIDTPGKETSSKTSVDHPAAEASKALEEKSAQTKKLDRTGEKIGEGIDRFGKKAAYYFGDWINAKILAGITWLKLLFCLLLLFLVAVFERFVQMVFRRRKASPSTEEKDIPIGHYVIDAFSRPMSLFIWVYGTYIVLTPLFIHFQQPDGANFVRQAAQKAVDVGTALAVIWLFLRMVVIVDVKLNKWAVTTESTFDDILAPLIGKTLRIFILVIGGIIVIQNLTGVKIGPLLASLGIGGIAIALAARESIANFFGTLTIIFDRPFQVGQRIVINNFDGVVESVGFRSTRIRTLTGHMLTIPNEKVVSSTVENIGLRPHIRWLTNIGITYDTPAEKVEKAVDIIREILDGHEGLAEDFPPRVYFNGFNDWSLNIMVIVWYHPPNYWDYQAWLQAVCLEIMRKFEAEDIDFAFPSRTVYLANDEKRQFKVKMLDNVEGPVSVPTMPG